MGGVTHGFAYNGTLEEVRLAILEGLADGQSLRAICRQSGMPSCAAVIRWASLEPEWAEQYARARALGDDAMAEDIQTIADNDDLKPEDRKVRIDARKWLLGKRQPKKYGERVTHAGDADAPLQVNQIVRKVVDPSA